VPPTELDPQPTPQRPPQPGWTPVFWVGFWFSSMSLWLVIVSGALPPHDGGGPTGLVIGALLLAPPVALAMILARRGLIGLAIRWFALQFVWTIVLSEVVYAEPAQPTNWLTTALILLAYVAPPVLGVASWLGWTARRLRLEEEWFLGQGGIRTASGFRVIPGDGESRERAIVVCERHPGAIPLAELEYLAEHLGIGPDSGYRLESQSLLTHGPAMLDLLKLVNHEGEVREVYFDVSRSTAFS
jgi:hypothetical protein